MISHLRSLHAALAAECCHATIHHETDERGGTPPTP